MPQVRPYRGIDAAERLAQRRARLIDAGLEILGAAPPAPELTVRTICGGAGVAMRYFYESFSDKDVFVEAVFDHVIADLATTTQAAVAAAPLDEQSRAGMANIVHAIADDPRVGRLLFSAQLSNEVVARKRNESTVFFAMLLGQHAGDALQLPAGDRRRASTHFAVGGVGQTLSAWLSGEITFTPDELIDHLALLLDTLGKRAVRR
ncbi:TetR/AcrR family transcriptional regulator [Mycobacterium sp. SMC-16]|uniref:TetR/AcrR family transcriptional regulator n=1 Tax=Mycobacteriaceae TaxID=1762 RepID=UPI000926BA7C|nr:TetR/AcrR family transcriptional regulator [Mycolicibacterium sp.]RUP35068.1 MAG: TetR/AcrR family transcriptional regulator [Mycolicibacterium sp.]SHW68560.1 transcriptional regulatory protein [Mycobacteroides abscessus subsp. abscessus]